MERKITGYSFNSVILPRVVGAVLGASVGAVLGASVGASLGAVLGASVGFVSSFVTGSGTVKANKSTGRLEITKSDATEFTYGQKLYLVGVDAKSGKTAQAEDSIEHYISLCLEVCRQPLRKVFYCFRSVAFLI